MWEWVGWCFLFLLKKQEVPVHYFFWRTSRTGDILRIEETTILCEIKEGQVTNDEEFRGVTARKGHEVHCSDSGSSRPPVDSDLCDNNVDVVQPERPVGRGLAT